MQNSRNGTITSMKRPATIAPWLTQDEMAEWVRTSPNQDAYQKRLAIWMTCIGSLHAHRVAEFLQVSKQAIWLWINQYNNGGPDGLERQGRGGRRRAYLSPEAEKDLVKELQKLIASGKVSKAKELLPEVKRAIGQSVSVAYVYRLLQRNDRRKTPLKGRPAKTTDMLREMREAAGVL